VFGISLPELLVVMVIVLIVFGPDKLPEIARTLGKWGGELRRNTDSIRREFYNTVYRPADELRLKLDRESRALISVKEEPPSPAAPTAPLAPAPAEAPPASEPSGDRKGDGLS